MKFFTSRRGLVGWYACFLVLCTGLLLYAGALVTTTGSGLAVPDWPTSFGGFNPTMTGGVFYEHGHRMVASFVGLVTIGMVIVAIRLGSLTVRRLAWLALGMVILQGLLGGMTVLLKLPLAVSVAHGCLAQLFFCTTVALAVFTTPSFADPRETVTPRQAGPLRLAAVTAFLVLFCQLVLGATMRHLGAGLVIPDFPTSFGRLVPPLTSPGIAVNFSHRVMACVVLAAVLLLAVRCLRTGVPVLRRCAGLMLLLVSVQITLGAVTVLSGRSMVPTSLHVVNGALLLATVFSTLLWAFRLSHVPSPAAPREPLGERMRDLAHVSRRDWMELFKVRLVSLVAFTAGCAYWIGAAPMVDLGMLARVLLGVCLLGAGSGALNHVFEVEIDARMTRTRNRPLPAGRVDTGTAEVIGAALGLTGILFLGVAVNPLCGLLAALALVSYVFVYTPLKRRTPLCTLVGAFPGALPVLIGWVAATNSFDLGGWLLFLILFLWQLPHFMAIAFLCREDYARAGLPMVTVVDPAGNLATAQTLAYTLALLPVSLAPSLCGMAGPAYFCVALVLGLAYLGAGVRLGTERTPRRARQLLLASVAYLPLIYLAMIFIP